MDIPIEVAIFQDLSLPIHPDLTRSIENQGWHSLLLLLNADLGWFSGYLMVIWYQLWDLTNKTILVFKLVVHGFQLMGMYIVVMYIVVMHIYI